MNIKKRKIINDPVYGFIDIPSKIIYDLIEHPYFQKLRRIKQLGLTNLIYPGATHTRFQHAIGATHLMCSAIDVIRSKGHEISENEAEAATIAILLHDIGHGPFSHTLEFSFISGVHHEDISLAFMNRLNEEFEGKLSLGIQIFKNEYSKLFLHQLVSSQLDMDRLDYLKRDSFFTGVSEGVIGSDRIIKMLDVVDDELVVEVKGIYSIEKFLIARRLMYWQVYLHKTVVSADQLLVKILERAQYLVDEGNMLPSTPALSFFLKNKFNKNDLFNNNSPELRKNILDKFSELDDNDLISSIKMWIEYSDKILSNLSKRLIDRNLFRIIIQKQPFRKENIESIRLKAMALFNLNIEETDYFVFSDSVSNNAYSVEDDKINILYKSGKILDIAEASDISNVSALSKTVKKYFLCYPKECDERYSD